MKKAIVWFIAGFIAATAFSAHAEVIKMIGKTVDGVIDLTINNQKMEYQAVLIDGTTYAPVRMLGEATGFIVRYDPNSGIKLIKKITVPREAVLKSITALDSSISTNEKLIVANEEELAKLRTREQTSTVLMDIKTVEDTIDRLKNGITGLNEQKSKLNQTLLDIDAQDAELSK